jgi:hypothetical protein
MIKRKRHLILIYSKFVMVTMLFKYQFIDLIKLFILYIFIQNGHYLNDKLMTIDVTLPVTKINKN